jgi:tartrate/fumarate subfamily iron-sulfur-dependent hydro-lyase alpha chain/tartrate/fumarate subfamily iron-sulfur-dependent hydro-lyase beta chain
MRVTEQGLTEVVSRLVRKANLQLPADVEVALRAAGKAESSPTGRMILDILLENARVSGQIGLPICQDTGIDVVFVEVGSGLSIEGDLSRGVNAGIADGTRRGFLRNSVCDPLTRQNTGDNTPAILHVASVPGDEMVISLLPKGCGSENMSALVMLSPSAGPEGVVRSVVDQVRMAGPNPCPPGVIGIGIGGTMEQAALLSKKALLRPLGTRNPRDDVADLEEKITEAINASGVGPLGLGGSVTTLGVAVEVYPCHIASLPVAINIQCHAARSGTARYRDGLWDVPETVLFSDGSDLVGHESVFTGQTRPIHELNLPLTVEAAARLRAGEWVFLNGPLYTARDRTHRAMVEMLERGERLPVDLAGQLIYYVGPSPAPAGMPVGAAGPTTSYRMDAYTPRMLAEGIRATMGKGRRSSSVRKALQACGAVYFATIGGAGAFLAQRISSCELAAFPEFGPEALYRMVVKDFPAVVIDDTLGNDYYEMVAGS